MGRPVAVALFGVGRWGPNLLRNLHNQARSRVSWVIDSDRRRLDEVARRFPDIAVSESASDALEDPETGAVVIATPASTHHHLARQALLAGRHCLVEKPLTTDSAQAVELADLADDRGLRLLVGHVFLHNQAVRQVRRLIDDDELGRVHCISMTRTNLGPAGTDVDVVWDLAPHDISIANHWLDAVPSHASACGGSWITPGTVDTCFATLRYPGDRLVNMNMSWLNPRKTRDSVVVGSRRMLTFDDLHLTEPIRIHDKSITADAPFEVVDSFVNFRASVSDGDILVPRVRGGEPLRSECEHFIDCITGRVAPIGDARSAVPVLRAVEAIRRSMAHGGCEEPVL